MLADTIARELSRIADHLSKRFPLKKIILFGSRATGRADEKSDIDLLIISEFRGRRRNLMTAMNKSLDEATEYPVDLVILTPEEFDREEGIPGTLARYASQHGRTVYERSS